MATDTLVRGANRDMRKIALAMMVDFSAM